MGYGRAGSSPLPVARRLRFNVGRRQNPLRTGHQTLAAVFQQRTTDSSSKLKSRKNRTHIDFRGLLQYHREDLMNIHPPSKTANRRYSAELRAMCIL